MSSVDKLCIFLEPAPSYSQDDKVCVSVWFCVGVKGMCH